VKDIDIAEVAQRSGVPASTLRYYEEIGLIASLGRRGLRRQFDADVLLKLSLISLGKAAGFSLVEIASLFGADGRPDLPRDRFRAKADELQRQILDLRALRDMLRPIADCPAPTHLECKTFRGLLKSATRGTLVPPASGTAAGGRLKSTRRR